MTTPLPFTELRAQAAQGPFNAHKYPDVKTWTIASTQSIASKIKDWETAELITRLLNADVYEALQQAVFAIPTTHGTFETVRRALTQLDGKAAPRAMIFHGGQWLEIQK